MDENKLKFPVILFDSKCPMCVRFSHAIKKLDPNSEKVHVTDLHQEWIYKTYPQLSYEKTVQEIHFLKSEDEIFYGSQAISEVLNLIPQAKKFSWLIESNSGKKAIEFFYSTTNKLKHSLHKSCSECTK